MATTEKFQSQLMAQLDVVAQYSINTVERHHALTPLRGASSMSKRAEKTPRSSDDILSVLKSARKRGKKLTSVECQRLMVVYDETVRRVEIAVLLPVICAKSAEFLARYSVQLGDELARAVEHHSRVAATSPTPSRSTPSRPAVRADSSQQAVESSVRGILRAISKNPEVASAFTSQELAAAQSSPSRHLMQLLHGFRKEIILHVAETRRDELIRQHNIASLRQIQLNRQKQTVALEREIERQTEILNGRVADRGHVLNKQVMRAADMDRAAIEFTRKVKDKADNDIAVADITEGIEQLKAKLTENRSWQEDLLQKQRGIQLEQRKRNFRVETEVDTWIKKYDDDMGEKQAQFDELDSAHNAEKGQLDELTTRFEKLSEQRNAILEERRLAAEKKARDEKELHQQMTAAIYLQYLWRKFRQRRALSKKKRKSGKKGKGSGKKGKGKGGGKKKKKK